MGAEKEVIQLASSIQDEGQTDDGIASIKKLTTRDHSDVGHDLYQESLEMDPAERARIAVKVLKKLDFCVLPMVSMLLHGMRLFSYVS